MKQEPTAKDLLLEPGHWRLEAETRRRWEECEPLAPELSLPTWVATEVRQLIDPEQWGTGFLAVHEREMPPQIYDWMRGATPQAFLRDLFRVAKEFYTRPEVAEGTEGVHTPMADSYRLLREALGRDPMPTIESLVIVVKQEQQRRREFLASEWRPARPDDAERSVVNLYPQDLEGEGE